MRSKEDFAGYTDDIKHCHNKLLDIRKVLFESQATSDIIAGALEDVEEAIFKLGKIVPNAPHVPEIPAVEYLVSCYFNTIITGTWADLIRVSDYCYSVKTATGRLLSVHKSINSQSASVRYYIQVKDGRKYEISSDTYERCEDAFFTKLESDI